MSAVRSGKSRYKRGKSQFVGVGGFEPPTSCSQSKRASQLCYTPVGNEYNANRSQPSMYNYRHFCTPGFKSRLIDRFVLWGLYLLAAFCLFACSPSETPTPTPVPIVPSATASLVPTITSTPTLSPTPTQTPPPACLSRPGELVDGVIDTALLPKPMTYHVYLPPCYTESSGQYYPVLFLLHGQTYHEDQWIRLGVPATADRLIATGKIPPFIIVFPYDYSYLQPSQYRFEDVFVEILIPQIDMAYRAIPDAAHRAVGGLSRGGAWALHLGVHHPDLFGAIGAHSPAIFYSDTGSLPIRLLDIPAEQLPRIYIDVGDADSELQTSQNFKDFLDQRNIPYEWHENIGFHDEAYWGKHVEQYLLWYAQPWQSQP